VHAQYFDPAGNRIGGEFRLNVANPGNRQLAPSGRHTLVYGVQGQVIGVQNNGQTSEGIYYTYLPPGYQTQVPTTCEAGDINGDGLIDGRDIQPFVDVFLDGLPTGVSEGERDRIECAMDCEKDRDIDHCDISVFVWLLLGLPVDGDYAGDCNENCRPDYIDLARMLFPFGTCGSSPPPCPCEGGDCCLCGLMPTSPPSGLRMQDCNGNEIDDATDIAEQTSADCNSNGMPDECEPDCNSNGYPDDCDVAAERSPDCNGNGYPDECDFDLPFLPSFDCNTNGVPDECDIASEYSTDENANNIPDECEEGGQQMMAGGGGETDAGGTPTPPGEMFDDPAWEEFFNWQFEQQAALRAMSRPERFEATRAKLRSLGLPDAIPWAQVRPAP
jgi:hypothetical protein